jgi:hypothetical protein
MLKNALGTRVLTWEPMPLKKKYNFLKNVHVQNPPPLPPICILLEKTYVDIGFEKKKKKGSICSIFFSKHKECYKNIMLT